jgi:O-antigen/teichoic acid export membrane protein
LFVNRSVCRQSSLTSVVNPKMARSDFNLQQRTVTGLSWSLGSQLLSQGSRFVISVVLARLLSPADFGLLGMTIVFTGFASLFSDFGFGSALVQRQHVEERHYSSVYWLTQGVGVVLAGLTAAVAPLVGYFYHEPRLVPVTMLVALSFPVAAQSPVQKAMLYRKMDFRALGLIDIVSEIIAGVVAIFLALRGAGVWSLVWQVLIASWVTALGAFAATRWRPRLLYDRAAIAELFGFSSNLMAFTAFNYWYRNGDNLLVGRFFGSSALGLYARAYNLMLLPITQITTVVSKVMFPALAKIQHDKARIRDIYLRAIAMIALVTFPLMLGLLSVSEHFILAVYGPMWSGVIPILRIFCILGMIQSIYTTVGWIFQSQGRTDRLLRWGVFSGSCSIAAMLVGIWLGTLQALALCLTIIAVLLLPYTYTFSKKLVNVGLFDAAHSVSGVFACSAAMAAFVWGFGMLLPRTWRSWEYLAAEVPFGIVVYFALVHVCQLAPYREFRVLAMQQLSAVVKGEVPADQPASAAALRGLAREESSAVPVLSDTSVSD